jgi:hypothetical protein
MTKMFKNIYNALSDAVEKITANHFPVQEEYVRNDNGWHVVNFKNEQGHTLQVEVQINDDNESIVMCVLDQQGFTNDQATIIMNTFEDQF